MRNRRILRKMLRKVQIEILASIGFTEIKNCCNLIQINRRENKLSALLNIGIQHRG